MAGNMTLAKGSTFSVQIGGVAPGTDYDQVSASGSVSIQNDVDLSFSAWNSLVPSAGQTFTLVSRSGGNGASVP